MKKFRISLFIILFALAGAVFFDSCSSHSEGSAIATELGFVDILISQGDTQGAMTLLKKTEKLAVAPNDFIGIYKRYATLGENSNAEKILKKALKKHKGQDALLAVYSYFLINQNRTEEALSVSAHLSSGSYSSIYAEAFLKYALESQKSADELFAEKKSFFSSILSFFSSKRKGAEEVDAGKKFDVFYDSRFATIYMDAFRSTGIAKWAMNAAVLQMNEGLFDKACEAYPNQVDSLDESLFWGLVFYDAGRYAESLQVLVLGDKKIGNFESKVEHDALEADNYYILGEDLDSERIRASLIESFSSRPTVLSSSSRIKKILPSLYVNSALYSKKQADPFLEYQRLSSVVSLFPNYEPALAAYAEYALACKKRINEDYLSQDLRKAGLRTLEMQYIDSIPFIETSLALKKIESAVETAPGLDKPALIVLREELLSADSPSDSQKEKTGRIWILLEHNALEKTNLYPEEIMRYSLLTLLENGADDEARRLFENYLQAAHSQGEDDVFVPCDHLDELHLWECEFAAWFYTEEGRIEDAMKLYDYIIKNYSIRNPVMNAAGQSSSVALAYINLANIYSASANSALAVDCLTNAVPRILDRELRAETLYRLGKENYYRQELQNAISQLRNALDLNPDHNKARLLLKTVQQAR